MLAAPGNYGRLWHLLLATSVCQPADEWKTALPDSLETELVSRSNFVVLESEPVCDWHTWKYTLSQSWLILSLTQLSRAVPEWTWSGQACWGLDTRKFEEDTGTKENNLYSWSPWVYFYRSKPGRKVPRQVKKSTFICCCRADVDTWMNDACFLLLLLTLDPLELTSSTSDIYRPTAPPYST